MKTLKFACMAIVMAAAETASAGGLLTNTNQNIAFLRNPARDAAIGIDGVYSNPAGVVFLGEGIHLSLNLQNAHQTRTVTSCFAPFAFGAKNGGNVAKEFKGEADAPVIPSLQAARNKGDWSFQFNFAITGGGGKCEFDGGLGSFESTVGMLPLLSQNLDALSTQLGMGPLGLPTVSQYDMDTYMRGRQYYYGFTFGAAYKVNEHLSVYGGLRMLYGTANYYGYVSNVKADIGNGLVDASKTFNESAVQANQALGQLRDAAIKAQQAGDAAAAAQYAQQAEQMAVKATMLGALGSATEDVTLNCDQTGWGIAPIIGIDYKTGKFNFAAKYEFKTTMELKNKSANSKSAENLSMLDRYKDGQKVSEDSPALLTVGAQWEALPELRVSAGWHYYFDKNAKRYDNLQEKLGGNTNEFLLGAEYDINKTLQVSAGGQLTRYDFTDDYMEDISFNVSSYSFGFGVGIRLNDKMKLNLAYFQTNYETYDRESNNYNHQAAMAGKIVGSVVNTLTQDPRQAAQAISTTTTMLTTPNPQTGKSMLYGSDSFTRTNRVLGIGLDVTL